MFTDYTGPAGFYSEPWSSTDPLYVSTLSIAESGSRPDQWVELSTEDTVQARSWADSTAAVHFGGPYTVDPMPPRVTQRYFEFALRHADRGSWPVRVHRSSYLVRSGFDLFHTGSVIGTLMMRPIDESAARGLAEYLWFLDHRQDSGTKVATSFSRLSQGSILHTIFFVHREYGIGLFGPYTSLQLFRNDYRIDSATGVITMNQTFIRET